MPKGFTPDRIDKHSKESSQEIAVLLIHAAGSTVSIGSGGSMSGKGLLQRHVDLASAPIGEFGGDVVRTTDESVMACFLDPEKAVKSAIRIQQAFEYFNREIEKENQIHVKIGVYFGKGIVEEQGVFGNMANPASKMMSLVDGDRICVSQAIYELVSDLPEVRFELCGHAQDEEEMKEIPIYEVLREETTTFEPIYCTLLYVKPLWGLGPHNFDEVWDNLLNAKNRLWGNDIVKERVLSDKSVVLVAGDVSSSITVANEMLAFLKKNLEVGADDVLLPVQAIIDSGPYLRGDRLTIKDLDVNWEDIDPGKIYISSTTYERLNGSESVHTDPPFEKDQPVAFYRLLFDKDRQQEERLLFSYQNALIRGSHPPCYYCGDRRHLTPGCPSKKLLSISNGLEKIGYLPPKKIDKLFFNYLKGSDSEETTDQDESYLMANHGFYELKLIYQLRFFRAIWGWDDQDWEIMRKRERGRSINGPLWQALDALRASNMPKAERAIEKAPVKFHRDYRSSCVSGFLEMEQNRFSLATRYFNEAFEKARTIPQKIFILFQVFRLFDLSGKIIQAENKLKEILWLYRECPEALYQEAIFKFRKGQGTEALSQLIKLIKKDRAFYIRALIDPDLAPFSRIIHPKLKELFDQAKENGGKIVAKAEEEMGKLKGLIGGETAEFQEAQSLIGKIKGLSESESYYGYLEIAQVANDEFFSMGQRVIQERRWRINKGLQEIGYCCEKYSSFVNNFSYKILIWNIPDQIKTIQAENNKIGKGPDLDTPDGYGRALGQIKDFSAELDEIHSRMEKMYNMSHFLKFLFLLLKYNLIFQAFNLFIVFAIIPLMSHYATSFDVPGHEFLVQNTEVFQMWGFVLGGIFWILVSFLTAVKKHIQEKPLEIELESR